MSGSTGSEHTVTVTGDDGAPTPHDEPEKPSGEDGSFKDYIRIFHFADKWDWILNIISLFSSIASGAALPLMTVIFGQFTSKFSNFASGTSSPEQFKRDVNHFTLWFIYLFVARFVLGYIASITVTVAGMRTARAIRKAFVEHLLRMEIWHFDLPGRGSPATQVTTNANRINTGIGEKLTLIIQGIAMFFSAFVVALVVQWKLALITISIIPLILVITGICMGIDAMQEARIMKFYSDGAVVSHEALSSIKTVHAFWAQKLMVSRFDEYLVKAHKEGNKKSLNYGVMFGTEFFCSYGMMALAFWQGHRMYLSGEIPDIGTVFTVVLSVAIAASSVTIFAMQVTALTNAAAAAAELFAIMDKPSSLDPLSEEGVQPATCTGQIEVRDLKFVYPSRPSVTVLDGFTLSIPAGKKTALVGASGSGKSTLVGLLERWYNAEAGSITLDGVELSEYNTRWLRTKISLVQQEPVLFRGTVYENVLKGLNDEQRQLPADEQRKLVEEACKASFAHDFIMNLPEGYNTYVGERASMLSGGQKQRVAIARSIISNPQILLLDEATSALDPEAEKIVQAALNRVSANRTTVTIAHRLSTIKDSDNIAVISKGKVVEQGTHQELIDLDGHYARLVRAQDLGGGPADETQQADDPEKEMGLISPDEKPFMSETNTDTTDDQPYAPPSGHGMSLIRCVVRICLELKDLHFILFALVICCLLAAGTYPAQAVLFSRLIQVFSFGRGPDQANFYALMFFVVAIGNFTVYFIIGNLVNIVSQRMIHRYRREMFERLVNMDMAFFDHPENTSGALTSKISTVPTNLQELISMNICILLVIIFNVLASSGLALGYGWKLSLVMMFAGLPLLIGSGYVRVRLEAKLESDVSASFSESADVASEAVGAIRTVASLAIEPEVMQRYSQLLDGIVLRSVRSLSWAIIPYAFSQSVEFLVMALGFWYGSRLLASGEYDTNQFFIVFIGLLFAGQAAGQFFGSTTSITKARAAANYLFWLRTITPVIRENHENRNRGPDGDADLNLKDVSFCYPQREAKAIDNVSINIKAGQFVAFVGASGCGKSTLISLLERYYDPTSGQIVLGNHDIKHMSPRLYRSHLSLVQQEPVLYQGSVRENISLGFSADAPPSEKAIHEACRQANALEFIESLPQGLETPCGSRGLSFSGGQRQRIAIARALIRNPRVLLLDEATSALDTQSERLVQAALDDAASTEGRTTVAVAHRLSTIRHADSIYVFADGKVMESGDHEQLQRLKGRYYEMCLAQSLDKAV
ncbi:ATP-binding cassette, subfamily B (MDR/TAP), member 1 [Aspergillus terreus]|uniref:ABC multidrug transporter MDR2 n=1 Tax=Aspergillus terreus TaxID=33178 RepID=A0A5M3Z787_ASPTE|nr:hypothetical protein ATETN484_0008036000 [Aspergillus terreus]GFF21188.1 ATP-binding cassette, subfamily B (MDR/TAP), member 1 [Aspergillus terreus]